LPRHLFGHAFHFIKNATRLDLGNPVLDSSLTLALTNLERLLGNRLVRKHPNPDLGAAPHVTRHCTASGLDLSSGQTTTPKRLQTELAETYRTTTLGEPAIAALMLLSEFRSFRL
jgi:hypothetical protein